jgi:hypothetical protein
MCGKFSFQNIKFFLFLLVFSKNIYGEMDKYLLLYTPN